MKASVSAVLVVGVLCLASCAGSPRAGRAKADMSVDGITRLIAQPREVVWSAIQAYMAQRKWPLAETNVDQGFIRCGEFRLAGGPDYAHCGSGRRSAVSEYEVRIRIGLRRMTANGTNVSVDSHITAISDAGRDSECKSTGTLEDELFAGIDSVVAAWR